MVILKPDALPQQRFHAGQRLYFVGIKGVAMTALAVWATQIGCIVVGSDLQPDFPTKDPLTQSGIVPLIGFNPDHIEKSLPLDAVIYTGAHGGATNPEVVHAQELGIPVYAQGVALGMSMQGKEQVSVAGCHGKTTTTAMVATIFMHAGLDPSYAVGCGGISGLGLPGHAGLGKYFIAEADEYITDPTSNHTPRFLWQRPSILAVTNIEYDHPDVYSSLEEVQGAYLSLRQQLGKQGKAVINGDDQNSVKLREGMYQDAITFGTNESALYRIKDVVDQPGNTRFSLITPEGTYSFTLKVPGRHNVANATAAIAVARIAGISWENIAEGLERFKGTKRRLETVGVRNGVSIIDDYAHHPTEIRASIAALRDWFPTRRIVVIFQPHTYTRTKALLSEFGTAFIKATTVAIAPIYSSAREQNAADLSSETVAERIRVTGKPAVTVPEYTDVVQFLERNTGNGDLAVFMGAGDINEWAYKYAKSSEILG